MSADAKVGPVASTPASAGDEVAALQKIGLDVVVLDWQPVDVIAPIPAAPKVEPVADSPASAGDDPVVAAQHDETGRMWWGLRSSIPARYAERYVATHIAFGAAKMEPVASTPASAMDEVCKQLRANGLGYRHEAASLIERLTADLAAMTASRDKAMRMFKAALAGQDRWAPCMDHRDKVDYRVSGCPQCQIEKAIAKVSA